MLFRRAAGNKNFAQMARSGSVNRARRESVNRADGAGFENRNFQKTAEEKIHENKNADVSQWLCIAKAFSWYALLPKSLILLEYPHFNK